MSRFHQAPVSHVAHVELRVSDLSVSLPFYQDALGFMVLSKESHRAVLGAKENHPILTLQEIPQAKPKKQRTAGLYHFAILLPDRKDLGKMLLHLLRNQIPLQGASDHGISEAIYLADPDGNGIEIAADTDPSSWPPMDHQIEWFAVNGPMDAKAVLAASENEPFIQLPEDAVVGHIHLHVGELAKTKQFYEQGLGMDVIWEFPQSAIFFSYGRYHHHVAINLWNGKHVKQPSIDQTGLAYFDIQFGTAAECDQALMRLQQLGYDTQTHDGIIWVKDPSGNQLRLLA